MDKAFRQAIFSKGNINSEFCNEEELKKVKEIVEDLKLCDDALLNILFNYRSLIYKSGDGGLKEGITPYDMGFEEVINICRGILLRQLTN